MRRIVWSILIGPLRERKWIFSHYLIINIRCSHWYVLHTSPEATQLFHKSRLSQTVFIGRENHVSDRIKTFFSEVVNSLSKVNWRHMLFLSIQTHSPLELKKENLWRAFQNKRWKPVHQWSKYVQVSQKSKNFIINNSQNLLLGATTLVIDYTFSCALNSHARLWYRLWLKKLLFNSIPLYPKGDSPSFSMGMEFNLGKMKCELYPAVVEIRCISPFLCKKICAGLLNMWFIWIVQGAVYDGIGDLHHRRASCLICHLPEW